jgi:cytochrome c oxidase subunit I
MPEHLGTSAMDPFRGNVAHDLDVPRDRDFAPEALDTLLRRSWTTPPGFWGWLSSVDHKSIGRRYIATAFINLLLAGMLAMVMRVQLAAPELRLLNPDLYNQVFTMHGTAMMFLFAVPMFEGAMIYLVPMMIGNRIIAFPRLNAFSYWIYLAGVLFLWGAFALGSGPDVGWFSYVPLAGPAFGVGKRPDVWAQMITFTEVSALAVAVELVVTIFKLRAPGMRVDRIPVFVWASLVTSFMIIFALPGVVLASTCLILDRLVGTHFFDVAQGGDVLLWQHLFWWFGHPEVYIIFLPALGFTSQLVETVSRRPVFGYPLIVLSIIATGLLSFALWVHHMFATGLPRLGDSFFTASSMSIAVPSGIVLFCWIATLASGRLRWSIPLGWILSFYLLFPIGGLTGVMLAAVPFDLQATDSYFVPGHIHFVLLGGAVAPLLGAAWMWFPKLTGRLLDPRLGMVQLVLFTGGVLLSFGPMLLLGMGGLTRRVWTYPDVPLWNLLNLLASLGGWAIGASFLVFLVAMLIAFRRPADAPADPWGAATLEWTLPSPPPPYNFLYPPVVVSRTPAWSDDGVQRVATGLRVDKKEILTTSAVDAEPDMRDPAPTPSIWPLIAAIVTSIIFVASIFTPKAISWGALPFAIALIGWLWPREVHAPVTTQLPQGAPP